MEILLCVLYTYACVHNTEHVMNKIMKANRDLARTHVSTRHRNGICIAKIFFLSVLLVGWVVWVVSTIRFLAHFPTSHRTLKYATEGLAKLLAFRPSELAASHSIATWYYLSYFECFTYFAFNGFCDFADYAVCLRSKARQAAKEKC